MANEFLKLKWAKTFQMMDLNKDNNISVADADFFADNFSKISNFDKARTEKTRRLIRRFWHEWVIHERESVDEATFVREMEIAYLADKRAFRKKAKDLFGLVMRVVDINGDKKLSEKEFENMVKSTSFENYDKAYMDAYTKIEGEPGFISLDYYLDVFVEFISNDDPNNIEFEKPRHYGTGLIDGQGKKINK